MLVNIFSNFYYFSIVHCTFMTLNRVKELLLLERQSKRVERVVTLRQRERERECEGARLWVRKVVRGAQ